jgi:KipI family sensor histidine kinase inhibitor
VTPGRGTRPVGDRGVLVELRDDDEVHRVAAAARRRFGGVLADVVAGHRTVLLAWPAPPVDPRVVEAVRAAADAPAPAAAPPRTVTVPVVYDGPDLGAVARHAGLSAEEVVRRHAAGRYRVAFVGFAPGFGYLLGADPALHVPRRAEPRERVPAGALALAGEYTAIYPAPSPGGWQLIGRTALRMFDPAREPPALLEPGVHVRFAQDPAR